MMLQKTISLLKSLTAGIYALTALTLVMIIGSFTMLGTGGYDSLNSMPLFAWLREVSVANSWWLILSLACLAVLGVNTVLCSIDSLVRKMTAREFLMKISPQIIHAGFLLILVAHIFSAVDSSRYTAPLGEQNAIRFSSEAILRVSKIQVTTDRRGFPADLSAVAYLSDGRDILLSQRIAPNHPAFYGGYGIYLKDARQYPFPAALIEITRDGGTMWAFAGGLLFFAGNVLLVVLKLRYDTSRQ